MLREVTNETPEGNMLILVKVLPLDVYQKLCELTDRLCGLLVRVSGYRYRGPGFDPRRYQIF